MEASAKQDLLHRFEGGSDTESDNEKLSDSSLRSYDEVVNYLI